MEEGSIFFKTAVRGDKSIHFFIHLNFFLRRGEKKEKR